MVPHSPLLLPLAAALALAACTGPAAPPPSPAAGPTDPTPASVMAGAALYRQHCAVCHGEDGHTVASVKNAPHLNSQALLTTVDAAFLRATIAQGRPGPGERDHPGTKMPVFSRAHGGPLTDLQIDQIVTYVRTWQTEPAIELAPYSARGDPVAGRLLYHQHCATCHGADGWGVDAPRLASQTFQSTASDAFIRQTIRSGRPGSSMAATALSEPQLADLITFIRTLADAPPTP